ncbi:MAG TPA: accessory regulator, partial [Ruminococcus sp.]|nr:accessory regulator [Ruminococcus sp.]
MLHTLSEKIADFLFDNNDDYPIEVYIYGIEITLSTIIGAISLLTAGLIFNLFAESIIYMISLSVIRMFSGGYHSKTYLKCNIVLIISYICSIL